MKLLPSKDDKEVILDLFDIKPRAQTLQPHQAFHPIIIDILRKTVPKNSNLDSEEIATIIGIYSTQYHPNHNYDFFKQLHKAPNQRTARLVFKAIVSWEFRRAEHSDAQKAIDCILKNTEKDLVLKQWILDKLDHGVFAFLRKTIMKAIPRMFKSDAFLNFCDVCKAGFGIFMFYVDLVKDFAAVVLFDHMSSNILVCNHNLLFMFSM